MKVADLTIQDLLNLIACVSLVMCACMFFWTEVCCPLLLKFLRKCYVICKIVKKEGEVADV